MAEYIDRETLKTACINALSFIAENANGEEEYVLNCEKTAYWDFDLHCFIEGITAEGKDALSNIRARRNAESSGVRILTDFIKELPAADVAPVVHAHWIWGKQILNRQVCSHCSARFDSLENDRYCPSCGAKMDEKDKTDE